jgi:hypothetical protein
MSDVSTGQVLWKQEQRISKISDLVGAQEVRWNKAGPQPADDYAFFYGHVKF